MERKDLNEMTDRVNDRLTDRFDDLRDKLARSVSAESSEARRALDRSTDALEKLTEKLGLKVDGLALEAAERFDQLERGLDRLESEVHAEHGRGWFSRLFWIATGAGLGAAAAYFLDPEMGRRRRDDLGDQLTSATNDAAGYARQQADYAAGVAKGAAVETAKDAFGGNAPGDPETLRQKIRSEVVGHLDGAESVVVAVHNDGRVTLKGSVRSQDTAHELIERTRQVPGVTHVESEVAVAA